MMSVQMRDMRPNEFSAFRDYSTNDYASDLIKAQSVTPEAALIQAGREFDELLPDSFLKIIENESSAVGVLWYLTEETDGIQHVFLNDFVISPMHRRKGYASAALAALALEARAQGCTEIRLYVSDDNQAAKALYERCGYHVLRIAESGAYLHKTI